MTKNDTKSKSENLRKNNKPLSNKNGTITSVNNVKTKFNQDSDKLSSKYVNGVMKVQDNNRIIFNTQVTKKIAIKIKKG